MKRIYITFGGSGFDHITEKVSQCYRAYGCDELWVYDDRWLMTTEFYRLNKWIFERQPQMGFGWCSWKPYIILNALAKLRPGDIVLYVDADCYPVSDLSCLFDLAAAEGITLFEEQGCINGMWTRRDCWLAMGLQNVYDPESQHACGRFELFRKEPRTCDFLYRWEAFSLDARCQFHEGSIVLPSDTDREKDDPRFIRNSAEQSVLSLLAIALNVPLHRTPDQNGWPIAEGKADKYPQLFHHAGHRYSNDVSGSRFRNV